MLLRIACRGCLGPSRDPGHITLPLFGWGKKDRGDAYVRIPSRPGCPTFPPLASLVRLSNPVARFVWGPDSWVPSKSQRLCTNQIAITQLSSPLRRAWGGETFLGSRDPRQWRGESHLLTWKRFGTLQR